MRNLLFRLNHQFWDFSRLLGLRDRLRCPICRVIGRWKPHGGWLDFADQRQVRRWLCKWCGWYIDQKGFDEAYMDLKARVWTLPADGSGKGTTPKKQFEKFKRKHGLQ